MTKQELEERGVNFDNMTYPCGEMNIIVQQFPVLRDEIEDEDEEFMAFPDIYQPRHNAVYSCGYTGDGFSIDNQEDRDDYISHLKDSSERLKIMSILLAQQAKELEETGEIYTKCYYPEEDKL